MPTLYLIDGHAQTFRAFYAVEGLTAPDGRPSGAIYGFTRMLRETIRSHEPDFLAVVFDAPGPTFRHEMYKEYKATRKPTPPALEEQVPVIQEVVQAFNIPIYAREGFEADDLIGTLARQAREEDLEVVVVSGDKDLAQLLGEHVRMYDPRKDAFMTAEDFREKRGVEPERLPDAMALWGDTSDNIPGVPGIGEKGAFKLIAEHGSLEALLERAGEIKGKRGENLRAHAEEARLSKQLATLDCAAPVRLDLETCRRRAPDEAKLLALYEDLGFDSLKNDLVIVAEQQAAAEERLAYALVNTPEAFEAFLEELRRQTHMAFDVETTSTDPLQAELVGMSFSWAPETGWYLPFRAPPEEPTLGRDELEAVAAVLADATVTKTGHNLKYDALVMRGVGAELAGIRFDSMLASHLLSGHLRGHSLDAVAERALGLQTVHIDEVIGKGKKQVRMDEVPLATVCRYACEDADVALRLEQKLQEDLAADADLQELFTELELPLSGVLTEMQHTGVRLDQPALARMSEQMEVQLERLTEEIYYLAGRSFNIGSPKQLAEVLFDELEFPVKRRTKTGRSTDERVLEELALESHPKQSLPRRVLEYRMYSKLKSTYIDALPAMVNPATGRIHTTFHQTGTVTGRLSSSNPNLQNIPVRTEEGRGIRAAFIPEPGWRLVAADYSQIELRVLAHLSGDPELQRAFHEGRDIHQAVAAIVFDVEEADVEPQQRRAAKAINFGIVYGQTAFGLARTTGMSRGEAQEFIDDYFTHFRGVETFLEKTIEQAHRDGFVRTLFRRRREIPDLASSNKTKVQQAERMTVNTTVQGTAADLIKRAMVALRRRLADEGLAARLLLQIHDELLLECPPEETDRLTGLLREEMEGAMELDVPLTVDLGTGGNWLEAK